MVTSNIVYILVYVKQSVYCLLQNGMTALILASIRGHKDVVETLLEAGAKPDIQDKVTVCVHVFVFLLMCVCVCVCGCLCICPVCGCKS